MEEKKPFCYYIERCKVQGRGCTPDMANASYCGFIAAIEKETALVKKVLTDFLRRNGQFFYSDLAYTSLKLGVKYMTSEEFVEAENIAVDEFLATEKELRELALRQGQERTYKFLTGIA